MGSIIIAGISSGSGKTTITTGLMKSLEGVTPFKAGPDYIDPKFHEFVTKSSSTNLDLFLMGEKEVKDLFSRTKGSLNLIEGVMGLYDGLGHELDNYSAAHLSRVLKVPVVLVVDGKGVSTSLASIVLGFKNLDPRVDLGGVIINNVGSEKLYNLLKEGIEKYTNIPCLGYLPFNPEITIKGRHLGLKQASEIKDLKKQLDILEEMVKKTIDLDMIKKIANSSKEETTKKEEKDKEKRYLGKKVGVARDEAFTFYYDENLKTMEEEGMEIINFSPLYDEKIPDFLDYIYLGGGYPESFSEKLGKNSSMIESLKKASKKIPIYGECGGFIYLTKGIYQKNGKFHPLAGILDITIEMGERLDIRRFGYVEVTTKSGVKGRAHEFHYSRIKEENEEEKIFTLRKQDGRTWSCGYRKDKVLGGYPHIHFTGNMDLFYEIFKLGGKDEGY